ncbi:MAG: 4'-phosphopantetheinyl transferase family protein [Myxococcaceae bacterium]
MISIAWQRVGVDGPPLAAQEEKTFSVAKRRDEYVAGRRAAHQAVSELVKTAFWIAVKDDEHDHGRPIVVGDESVHISISHSEGWAVAAATRTGPVGIDLEPLSRTLDLAFCDEAFAEGELEGTTPLQAWVLKEAVLKVWGVGLRAPLGQVCLRYEAPLVEVHVGNLPLGLGTPPARLNAKIWRERDFLLALASTIP